MKKLSLISLTVIFLFSTTCWADLVTLQWDSNTETYLGGYHVYRAGKIGEYTTAWEKIATIENRCDLCAKKGAPLIRYTDEIDKKSYVWIVTAFDRGMSNWSCFFLPIIKPPKNLKIIKQSEQVSANIIKPQRTYLYESFPSNMVEKKNNPFV